MWNSLFLALVMIFCFSQSLRAEEKLEPPGDDTSKSERKTLRVRIEQNSNLPETDDTADSGSHSVDTSQYSIRLPSGTKFTLAGQSAELSWKLRKTMDLKNSGIIGTLDSDGSKFSKDTVEKVFEGFPADNAGIQVGDEILSVDGKQLKGLSIIDRCRATVGRPGSKAKLKVKRGEEIFDVTVIRADVKTVTDVNMILHYIWLFDPI